MNMLSLIDYDEPTENAAAMIPGVSTLGSGLTI